MWGGGGVRQDSLRGVRFTQGFLKDYCILIIFSFSYSERYTFYTPGFKRALFITFKLHFKELPGILEWSGYFFFFFFFTENPFLLSKFKLFEYNYINI